MEKERIQKFKDLILNEHYCEDCNELCGIGESFPLEFVAKYIIKLEKENESKEKAYNDCYCEFKHYKQYESIPKSKVKEKIEEYEEMKKATYTDMTHYGDFRRDTVLEVLQVLQELMEDK